jgi:hypothetical protein
MRARITSALVALVVCGLAPSTRAEEYCVTCTGPDAKYRCIIGGNAREPASRGQLLCITELAQSGNHESCSVGRTQNAPCDGQPRTVMFTSAAEAALPHMAEPPPALDQPKAEGPPLAVGEPPPAGAPSQAPPKTVEELAKQTVVSSGNGLKKAGEAVTNTAKSTGQAVGNAVSKTWRCMTSLFSDC